MIEWLRGRRLVSWSALLLQAILREQGNRALPLPRAHYLSCARTRAHNLLDFVSVVIRGRSDSCDTSAWEPNRGTESGGVDCVTSSIYSEAEVFISFHFPAHVTG